MDDALIVRQFENVDRRLESIEQFLPTLATKQELREAIAPLATKQELRDGIALLATKEELRGHGDMLRRHMDVLTESLRSDIQLLAEHLSFVMTKLEDR